MESGRTTRNDGEAQEVEIAAAGVRLQGVLLVPPGAKSLVLFAHGSGSNRFSPRNRYVAGVLHKSGLATLMLDLLTQEEERQDIASGQFRFDIGMLAGRLAGATLWAREFPETRTLTYGYFGASTGAGAALVAAAELPDLITAVVSRGGRPDLAGSALATVKAPTLLIVGGNDGPVIELNRTAMQQIEAICELSVIAGATHLFEEPGALEKVAWLARDWFLQHLDGTRERGAA